MPSWDKCEVVWFNAKALLLLVWSAWAALVSLLSRSNSPSSVHLFLIGSSSPLAVFWKGTALLSVRALQLSEKAGSLLEGAHLLLQGQSFAIKGIFVICFVAILATVVVVTGMVSCPRKHC